MEEGQTLSPSQLQVAARRALQESEASQSEAARALGVSRSTISKAFNKEDPRSYVKVLRGIVEKYTAFRVSDVPRYQVKRRDASS